MRDGEIVMDQRSLAKGVLAGLIGGLVATAAKSLAEKVYPPRTHGEPEPPGVFAEKIAGRELRPIEKTATAETIHWGFGAAAGAAYGALVEYFPAVSSKEGASFGLALEGLTHGAALESEAEPEEMTTREQASEVTSHVVYGVATELVRGFVRRWL